MATRLNSVKKAQIAMPQLVATLATFDRATLAGFIEVALAVLDCADGDPEAETSGTEDDFTTFSGYQGPGCPVTDNDHEHDGAEPNQGSICLHYRVDQSIIPIGAMWAHPVYTDTVL